MSGTPALGWMRGSTRELGRPLLGSDDAMAQAGLHAIIGVAATRPFGHKSWFRAGVIVGSMLPDLDILVVAIATLAHVPAAETAFHRTFSHSLFAVVFMAMAGWGLSKTLHRPLWVQFGTGLAVGMAMHIAVDLLLWFRGVRLFWPAKMWLDYWREPPAWWIPWGRALELPFEFGWFSLLFTTLLFSRAGRQDPHFRSTLRWWAVAQFALFFGYSVLAVLAVEDEEIIKKFYVIPYLVSLVAACVISCRTYASNVDTPATGRN